VGLDMGETSAIESGLKFGDRLIIAGQHSVTEGSPVEVVEEK